jgi:hypothetical protein
LRLTGIGELLGLSFEDEYEKQEEEVGEEEGDGGRMPSSEPKPYLSHYDYFDLE